MKLSWVGWSSILLVFIVVIAFICVIMFAPNAKDLFSMDPYAHFVSFPAILLAIFASILFLQKSKNLEKHERRPWKCYSFFLYSFVLAFAAMIIVKNNYRFIPGMFESEYAMLWIFILIMSYFFIILGLGAENEKKAWEGKKNLYWPLFIPLGIYIVKLIIPSIETIIPNFNSALIALVIGIIPIWLCFSVVRKAEKPLKQAYMVILASLILFVSICIAVIICNLSLLLGFGYIMLFSGFTIAFDARLSIHQTLQSPNQ